MKKLLGSCARLVRSFLGTIFGDISFAWRPPGWASRSASAVARKPLYSAALFLGLIVLVIGAWVLAVMWKHRPVPLETTWIIQVPPIAAPDDQFQPQRLVITFDRSVAQLNAIGKPVTKGVTLSPALPGTWRWTDDKTLAFEPTQDWPAATTYDVTLDRAMFSKQARFATLQKQFQTPAFTVDVRDPIFYIDPTHPATKQITATLVFSHPVDRASLEASLKLTAQDQDDLFGSATSQGALRTITYDKRDRIAYVRSANITLPQNSAYATLHVDGDLHAALGDATLDDSTDRQVLVPSLYDLFHFDSSQVVIATNKEGEPKQALVLHGSVGMKTAVLAGALHAWVLPPRPGEKKGEFIPWDGPAQVTSDILAKAKPVKIEPIATGQEYDATQSFRLAAPEKSQIYLAVDKGMTALGGFPLGAKYDAVCSVPPYPREIRLMNDGALLALNGERKLTVLSRGVEELEYRVARVTPNEINHLVSQSSGNFQNPIFDYSNFSESDMTELTVSHQSIAMTSPGAANYSSFDLSDYVKDNDANEGKLGLFIVHILGRKPGNSGGYYQTDGDIFPESRLKDTNDDGETTDPSDFTEILSERRLILVTDMGLLVKDNADGTHDLFVQSIKSGGPVGGAKVQVLGKNGLPLVTAETDDNGRAAIPSLADFSHEKRPVAYLVQRDRDVSFLPFGRADRELNFSRFDIEGISGIGPDDLTAFVFTDRGLYRPGDTAKIGLVVKQHNWRGNLAGVPLELDIVDPRGRQVDSRIVKCDAAGFIDSSFPTLETSPTGEYEINCYLAKDDDDKTLIGTESFIVREFLPDRLKIAAKLSPESPAGWISQKGLSALITLRNLYGAPAAGNRVTGQVTLTPSEFHFDRYPDYSFADPYLDPKAERKYYEDDLTDQTTDDSGQTTFDLATKDIQPSAYALSFLAEGYEKEGGRSVAAYANVLVSPSPWLLGTKPDGDFGYVTHGSKRSVRLLAVDPGLKPVAVEHLTLKLVEIRHVSVLTQQSNGNYAYESILKEIPVKNDVVPVPAGGIDWPLATGEPGDFAARFYDDSGDLMADVRYSVAGAGNLARALDKNAELTAKLSQAEYHAGDDIEISITAPYTGAGLITIERDKVYAAQWFQAATTSSVQKIRIPADFEGNGYVNVAFVRALDSHEIYTSPLSYAVIPFRVNREARHTVVSIQAPALAVPGQPLNWTVQASRPTRAVVYAVDEGILQVAHYSLPDPLEFFFRKEQLGVDTRQTVDLILPEYSISRAVAAAGGDGDEDLLASHLNPFKRKTDQPVVFWSGVVDLGPQPKSFIYPVPDYFAGSVRIMVVAASPDAVGSTEKTLNVRGPFVISPNVPTFVAPGDTFDLSVTVANNVKGSGPAAPVAVDLSTNEGLEITQKPGATVPIDEGRDASVHWLVKAKDLLGNADLTVSARLGGQSSSLVSHLSVRPPVAYLTTVESGYFTGADKRIPVTRHLYPQFRQTTALASVSPQGLSRGLGLYLEHYEYGCTEQLVSKALPSLVSSSSMPQGQSQTEIVQKLNDIFAVLASRQNDQGAIGLWDVEPDLHFDLPSIWSVQLLTEAKERGFDVPDDLMTRALDHLQQMAKEDPTDFEDARNQAEAIYLLTRNGRVTTNFLEHNRAWFEANAKDTWGDDIACAYSAASYQLLKNQAQADELIVKFHLVGAQLQAEDDYYNELGRDSEYVDLLALHFPERLKKLSQADLMAMVRPIMDGDDVTKFADYIADYNTISAAQAILALDAYGRAVGSKDNALGDLNIDEAAGQITKPLVLTGGLYREGTFDGDVDALVFHKPAKNEIGMPGLFYQITQAGFDRDPVTTPISEGIEVSREYHDKDGNPVNTVKLGGDLTVVLRVRGVGDREIDNVAVLDLLPGGFEVVPESIQTGSCHFGGIDYADVREDRVAAFGTISNDPTEITYRIRATNKGTYAVPPPQAEAMYHLKMRARGTSDQITVTDD
jgi:alpha-2-macroglobulin